MKKLFLILILSCFIATGAWALFAPMAQVATDGAALVCTLYDEFTTGQDGALAIAKYANNEYGGTLWNDAASGGDICQVDWYVVGSPGAPSVNDYYCEIWSVDGSSPPHLNALQGRSDKVDGNDNWATEFVVFAFSSDVSYSQSTDYAIILKAIDNNDDPATVGEYDDTNYITIGFDDENNSTTKTFGLRTWKADGTDNQVDVEDDMLIKVHTKQ